MKKSFMEIVIESVKYKGNWSSILYGHNVSGDLYAKIARDPVSGNGSGTFLIMYTGTYKYGKQILLDARLTVTQEGGYIISAVRNNQRLIFSTDTVLPTRFSGTYESQFPRDKGTFHLMKQDFDDYYPVFESREGTPQFCIIS